MAQQEKTAKAEDGKPATTAPEELPTEAYKREREELRLIDRAKGFQKLLLR